MRDDMTPEERREWVKNFARHPRFRPMPASEGERFIEDNPDLFT
jgi:hypothetical protein